MKSFRRFLAFASGALLIFFLIELPALAAEGAAEPTWKPGREGPAK